MTARPAARIARAIVLGLVIADAAAMAVVLGHVPQTGWRLNGDNAVTVLRGSDVLSANTPLVGMPSGFSGWSSAADPFHPGPVGLWPLAPTAVFGTSETVILVTVWLVSVVSTAVIVAAAKRMRGWGTAAGAATFAVAFQVAIVQGPVWMPIPPILAAQPALALCFVAWGVVGGRARWWPGLAVLAALVAGSDLAYATIVVPLVVLAAGRTGRDVIRAKRSNAPPPMTRRTVLATAAAIVVTCALPVIDAVVNGGGNVLELLRAARAPMPTAGLGRAADTLVDIASPGSLQFPLGGPIGLVFGIVAFALAIPGLRVRKQGMRPLIATAAIVAVGAVVGQAQAPAAAPIQFTYLLPVRVATALVWFTISLLAWHGAASLAGRRSRHVGGTTSPRWRLVPAVATVLLLLVLVVYGVGARDHYLPETAMGLGPVADQLDDALPDGTYQWVALGGQHASAVSNGVLLRAIQRGIEPRFVGGLGKYYGSRRAANGSERSVLYLTLGHGGAPVPGAEPVARWKPSGPGRSSPERAHQLAEEIRAHGITILPAAGNYRLGSLALGFGGATRTDGHPIDDAYIGEVGAEIRDDPAALAALPDEAVLELAGERSIDVSWLSDQDLEAIEDVRAQYPITVWKAPA